MNVTIIHTEGRKLDTGKPRYELIPVSSQRALAEILTMGSIKYGDRNWEKGFAWGRAYAALQRHLTAWWDGEGVDAESGKSHLWHAMCELAFLIEFEAKQKGTDDRPNTNSTYESRCTNPSEVDTRPAVPIAPQ